VSQGLVRCFGGNGWAQLGDGGSGKREQPVLVAGITQAHAVAASRSLSCALHGDGISCWGTRATAGNDMNPLERHVALRDATAVVLDEGGTCATRSSGENVCWGATTRIAPFENDAVGVFASHEPKPLPFALGRLRARNMPCYLDEVGLLVCGQMLDAEGERQATVSTRFDEYERHTGVLGFGLVGGLCKLEAKQVRCFDDDQRPRELPKLIKPSAIAGGDEAVCVIHDGGKLGCFAPTLVDDVPRTTELLTIPEFVDIVQILAIDRCFGAVDGRGDVRTFCLSQSSGALELAAVKPWPLTEIVELIIHPDGLCGRTRSQEFACMDYETQAITREFSDVVDVAGNWQHTCVLQADGVLTCMGDNRFGQLGAMPQTVMAKPVAIEFAATGG
jgi:hypothetical protein